MEREKILVIDDDIRVHGEISKILGDKYEISFVKDAKSAINTVSYDFNLILLDLKLPDIDGLELLKRIKEKFPDLPIVIISAFGTIATAVSAIKLGADDFIEKPLDLNRVKIRIRNVLKKREIERKFKYYESIIQEDLKIVYSSPLMKKVIDKVERLKNVDVNVLILGETGVGKELIARAIHFTGKRKGFPFVKVNCSAIPETLFESELFGYEKGAFTDARADKKGKAELANKGTLFLDEIGDMSPLNQSKILDLIEDKEISPLGSIKRIKVDIRIIAASNKNLFGEVKKGNFREDLFARLNVALIEIPPLRERKEDIPVITKYFIQKFCEKYNKPLKEISKKAIEFLFNYPFKRNVRELRSIIENVVIFSDGNIITKRDIESAVYETSFDRWRLNIFKDDKIKPLKIAKKEFEKNYILFALEKNSYKMKKTARELGIDRTHLYKKIKELRIKVEKEE